MSQSWFWSRDGRAIRFLVKLEEVRDEGWRLDPCGVGCDGVIQESHTRTSALPSFVEEKQVVDRCLEKELEYRLKPSIGALCEEFRFG